MKKKEPTRSINIRVPVDLYETYSKTCIDYGISRTEGIVQYLLYLKKQVGRKKELLHERAHETFKLAARDVD